MDPVQLENWSQSICQQLEELINHSVKPVKTIHAFLPMDREINIVPLLQKLLDQGKTLVTPKTLKKRQLEHLILEDLNDLEDGVFGTQHPASGRIFTGNYDLIIVPGLAFDKRKNRIGYGAGYYDTFMQDHPKAFKVGIGFPFQFLNEIPVEAHDVRLDLIITPDFLSS